MFPFLDEFLAGSKEKANWVYIVFCAQELRKPLVDWESHARRLLAEFRASLSDSLEDPWVLEIIDRLKADSPEFNQWWREHDVRDKSVASIALNLSDGTRHTYERSILRTPENPRVKLLLFTPVIPEQTA
jgi:hypothetical protein